MTVSFASKVKILIVDDQPLAQSYLKFSLESLGYTNMVFAERAQRAIQQCREQTFDLILCSFNLSSGSGNSKDGYQLYEELKQLKHIKQSTAFVFISAETDTDLVHGVIELQPDDFIAKPFSLKQLGDRVGKVLAKKQLLKEIFQFIDDENYSKAIKAIDKKLSDRSLIKLFPTLLKIKGDILLRIYDWRSAITFFQHVLDVQKLTWAKIGLVEALVNNQEDERALIHLEQMIQKPETRLLAYDMLSQLKFKNKEYKEAFENLRVATKMSPRNILRQEKLVNLSRINHDYEAQFKASKDIVKFAKNSVHDAPSNYLNVARSAVDYALTSYDEDTNRVVRQTADYLNEMKKQFPDASKSEQLAVVNARLHHLKNEKEQAKALIDNILHQDDGPIESIEDELDKAKAFHQLGFYEKSSHLFDRIEQYCVQTNRSSNGMTEYIQQERQERRDITQTPKDLNNTAVSYYSKGNWSEAYNAFYKAFQIMPKNASIALNLLQTICDSPNINIKSKDTAELVQQAVDTAIASTLDKEQSLRFEKLRQLIHEKQTQQFDMLN